MPDIFINQDKPNNEEKNPTDQAEQPERPTQPESPAATAPEAHDIDSTQAPTEFETLPHEEFPRQEMPESPPTPAALDVPPKTWIEQHQDKITLMQKPAGKPGLFTAFAARPEGITFEHQEPGEEIILLVRKHFFTNIPWIALSLVAGLIPIIIIPFLSGLFEALSSVFSGPFMFIFLGFYYLIILGFILNQFVTWFYQVGIVTNVRVIDVDFNTILSRNIAYTDITDIVDTEAHQKGILQGMFNYGSVGLQTAGMKANFEFSSIPQPNTVVDTISDLMRDQKHHG